MNDKNDKQITKSQIELLKQKYLRKNIQTSPVQELKEVTKQPARQYQPPQAKLVVQKRYSLNENCKTQQKQPAIPKADIPNITDNKATKMTEIKMNKETGAGVNKQFSLKTFIQQNSQTKKQEKPKEEVKQLQQISLNRNDPFSLKIPFQYCLPSQTQIQTDPQFAEEKYTEGVNLQPKRRGQEPKNVDLGQACRLWLSSARKALLYLYFSNPSIDNQDSHLKLKSQNPSFPGIVQQMAEHFIFNSSFPLKENQKQVVYNMALEYFSPSPEYLSDVLLVSLIKMSPTYASIYVDEIIRKIGYYAERIIELRKYIIKEELDSFVRLVEQRMEGLRVDGHKIADSCYIWLLILRPNSNYCNQILLVRNLDNEIDLFAIFCALFPEGKESSLSLLYLKCIDMLVPLFVKTGILEKVISHLNQIKVPEALYQPVKSLKLKLIRAADTKKQKRKGEDDRGFTVFLNQKIVKLKEALQSKINIKMKPSVYFDPSTGRYQPSIPSSPSR